MADGTAKRMMPQRQPERIVSGQAFDEDARIDVSVRPKRLDEYIGQKRVKENIQIAIDAALSRGEALDHVLLYGPPGLGAARGPAPRHGLARHRWRSEYFL